MFAVNVAVFVHVVNLERLAADGGGGDVVVVATEKDGLDGEAEVFDFGKVVDEHVVFVDVSNHGGDKSDGGKEKQPPSEASLGEVFGLVASEFFGGSPVDDDDIEEDEGDDEELFDAFAFKKGDFFFFGWVSHKKIITNYLRFEKT